MRKEKIEKLNDVIKRLSVKNVENIDVPQEKKFIQSKAKVFTLNTGDKIYREELLKGGYDGSAVIILPVIDNEILTVIEPRVFTKLTVGVGFPAGYIDDDEDAKVAAERELREETGCVPKQLIELDSFYQDEGCSSAFNRVYLALDCVKKYDQKLDKDEYIEYMTFNFEELKELEKQGYICGGNSKIAIARLEEYLNKK